MTVEQLWQPFPGGSGTYIKELASALTLRDDVDLVGMSARHSREPAAPWTVPSGLRVTGSRLPRVILYEAWSRFRSPRIAQHAKPADVLHATTWAVPQGFAPLVVTVHDLAFLRDPSHFTQRGNSFFRRALDIVRAEAAVVIAVSGTTRDDCIGAGIEPERIRVIHHGSTVPDVQPDEIAAFRARHGLTRPYVLWCGTLEPRKNLEGLLAAFGHVLAAGSDLDLVLVGPSGWGNASARLALAAAELPAERIHQLGTLAYRELHSAYAGARAFCFPSHWEGFGLPVLEAMSHGVPVVTSKGTAMAEISGAGALLVDPMKPPEIAAALLEAATTEHDRLSRSALTQSSAFTWQRCASETMDAYRAAAQSKQLAL